MKKGYRIISLSFFIITIKEVSDQFFGKMMRWFVNIYYYIIHLFIKHKMNMFNYLRGKITKI
jgi:hypothetical protein